MIAISPSFPGMVMTPMLMPTASLGCLLPTPLPINLMKASENAREAKQLDPYEGTSSHNSVDAHFNKIED